MKRKINMRLLAASFVIVIIACAVGVVGTTCGSVYIKTKGTPSENIINLFDSITSGDGNSCVLYSNSYSNIDFNADGETEVVTSLCNALKNSYSYVQKGVSEGEDKSLSSVNTVQFSFLDLNKLSEDINAKFENYVFDTVQEYDTNVTTDDGKYIDEVYEKAYVKAVSDSLQNAEAYYSSETFDIYSSYDIENEGWRTEIDNDLARMIQGGLTSGVQSDALDIPEAVKGYTKDSVAVLMGEPVLKKTDYSLSREATVAPKPDEGKYVSVPVDHADKVLNIISYARSCGLLGTQEMIFNPKADFYPEDIVYYCDDSILVICWKEFINGCLCNCMEVKLADGSQIRRKLTGDTYGSGKLDTVSNMSAATNAVSAMSADYYAYRDIGVTVYRGELYRYQLSCEVLMIDENGKFVFYYPDNKSAEELQKFIDKNKIQFSLAFGPVLIDNYKPRYYTPGYAFNLGEMTQCYSRSAFGEFDDLHYLFMTSGYSETTAPPANLDAFIDILTTKNMKNVYNLDGGQTAEIVFKNKAYNQIDYGGERQVSDMVYFATAVPDNTEK